MQAATVLNVPLLNVDCRLPWNRCDSRVTCANGQGFGRRRLSTQSGGGDALLSKKLHIFTQPARKESRRWGGSYHKDCIFTSESSFSDRRGSTAHHSAAEMIPDVNAPPCEAQDTSADRAAPGVRYAIQEATEEAHLRVRQWWRMALFACDARAR